MSTFRTPPLSEFDFSISVVRDSDKSEVSRVEVKDLQVQEFRRVDRIVCTSTEYPVKYTSLTPSIIDYIDQNVVTFKELGHGRVKATSPVLSKILYIDNIAIGMAETEYVHTYQSGSLGEHITNRMASLLSGKDPANALHREIFINRNEEAGSYEWNPGCWAYPVNLTCMAPWRDRAAYKPEDEHWKWPVTAITPRHIALGHVGTDVGEGYHFFTRDNQVVKRTVTSYRRIVADEPYFVAVLDSDLPPTITPAKLLPDGELFKKRYLPTLDRSTQNTNCIPVIATDQQKHAVTNPFTQYWRRCRFTFDTDLYPFSEEIIGGDSSCPVFTEINGETVLLTSWYFGGGGSGFNYSWYFNDIKTALDTLHGGSSPYYPETVSVAGFTQFD